MTNLTCYECGAPAQTWNGTYRTIRKGIGHIAVPGVTWEQCTKHRDHRVLPGETCLAIEAECKAMTEELLKRLPITDFITEEMAMETLKISKGDLNRTPATHLVYYLEWRGIRVYYTESVAQFYETGDGRVEI